MKTAHPRTRTPFLSRTGTQIGFCLSILFFVCSASTIFGQGANPAPSPLLDVDKATDFRPLFDERERLQDELQNLEDEIDRLADLLRDARKPQDLELAVKEFEKQIADESKKGAAADLQVIETYKNSLESTQLELKDAKREPELKQKKEDRVRKKQRLSQIDQKIAMLTDDKRDMSTFRAISTGAFSLLVAVVVGGFYLIAWFKDGIAAKIFSGEMGMQFVTLFLIVIAIILFGIMGTLEGRELAALLGGLSGYILGKASAKVSGTDESGPGNQNQQPRDQNAG